MICNVDIDGKLNIKKVDLDEGGMMSNILTDYRTQKPFAYTLLLLFRFTVSNRVIILHILVSIHHPISR